VQLRGARAAGTFAVLVAMATFAAGAFPADVAAAGGNGGSGAGVPGAHECVPRSRGERGKARVAWKQLRNPVFALDHMVKDQAIRLVKGRFHLFYSERTEAGAGQGGTGHAVSRDLATWKEAPAVQHWGSPDITRAADGRYLITYQQQLPSNPEVSKLHFVAAKNVGGAWSAPVRLIPGIFEEERTIDGALAHTRDGLFLLFKRGAHTAVEQHDGLAWSPSGSPDGPWSYVGETDLPWSENFQFHSIDGTWHVLLTEIPIHRPALYRLAGDPADPESWRHWTLVRQFDVPQEEWNRGETPGVTHETANSAYLCDARRLDGYWYLFYAGSTELTTFEGRGHAKIGVARSKDLERWEVPPS
jgi:hypothetical protein